MARFNYEAAKADGYTDEEIQAFLSSRPDLVVEAPQVAPNTPDVTSPFQTEKTASQAFNNYNPGMGYYNNLHKGEDYPTNIGEEGTAPIGGEVVSNTYDPVYGYTVAIKGLNPQEYVQGGGQPDEDIVKMSHLAEAPPWVPGSYVATGSAGLKYGSTGHSTGPHVDIESYPESQTGNYAAYKPFSKTYGLTEKAKPTEQDTEAITRKILFYMNEGTPDSFDKIERLRSML